MRQVIQSYKTGEVRLEEVPTPVCRAKGILVSTHRSLISIGTERQTIALGQKSLLGKAKSRPDLVKRALEKARKEGYLKTFQEAMGRLDTPTPLGYSAAGVVLEAGLQAHGFAPGDRVACVGQGFASHAEVLSVPINLACKIPANVTDDEAAFGMLGTIALHGIHKAKLDFGSIVVVQGLGLLGLLTVQLLHAYGCRVYAIDLVAEKTDLARPYCDFVSTDPNALEQAIETISLGRGADACLLTVATTSDEPIHQAVSLCKNGGKVVVVGVADIHPDRNELWHKEVEIVVSRAGGPGALDPLYELGGFDVPYEYSRWSQQRNLAECLRLMAEKRIDVQSLISHRFTITDAESAYQQLMQNKLAAVTGVLFEYPANTASLSVAVTNEVSSTASHDTAPLKYDHDSQLPIAVIGAGVFGKALLIPALKKTPDICLHTLVTATGGNAAYYGKKYGFLHVGTDKTALFKDPEIKAVFGLTPHRTHAELVRLALEEKTHLFIEKPLCIDFDEWHELQALYEENKNAGTMLPVIMVGHNRRYSPHTQQLKTWLSERQNPLVINLRVNAGFVPNDHWVHSDAEGRSRIIGEMTHFLDLVEYLVGERVVQIYASRVSGNDVSSVNNDNVITQLKFVDGSIANLVYTASGYKGYSREHLECFFDGKTAVLEDFRVSTLYAAKTKKFKTSNQAIGYTEELNAFIAGIRGNTRVPSFAEALKTMQLALQLEQSLATGRIISWNTPH